MSTIQPDDRFYDRVQPNRLSQKDERILSLEKKLSHAFRKGLNVRIQGLHRLAPSDHLPIEATFQRNKGKPIHVLSWNMLSDTHLGNYYRNISIVTRLLEDPAISASNKFKSAGHWLLFFIADHLRKSQSNEITIDKNSLINFLNEYKFDKAFSQKDAKEIVDHYLEGDQEELFMQSIAHAVEIHFSITEGYLRWENRFSLIKTNKALLREFTNQDIICLQECTNPKDISTLLSKKNHEMISHSVRAGDHAVIIFDPQKHEIMKDQNNKPLIRKFSLGHNSKPCILAVLKSATDKTASPFIIGSIHHPGGDEDELELVQNELQEVQGNEDYDVLVMGDFNHIEDFFKKTTKKFAVIMPGHATMAGPDYGSTNKSIDGIYTNRATKIGLKVVEMPIAPSITLPLHISIKLSKK